MSPTGRIARTEYQATVGKREESPRWLKRLRWEADCAAEVDSAKAWMCSVVGEFLEVCLECSDLAPPELASFGPHSELASLTRF